MKQSLKQILLIGISTIIILLINFLVPSLLSDNKVILLLLLVLVIMKFTIGLDFKRNSNRKRVLSNILIVLFTYYLFTYFSGLFIGFTRTIYNHTLNNFTKNIVPTATVIVLSEIIRNQLIIKSNKDYKVNILTFFMFTLLEISVNFSYYDFSINDYIYAFIATHVFANIAKNILMTIINNKTDYFSGIVYRLITEELLYIVLIQPAFGVYLNSVLMILLPSALCLVIINTEKRKIKEKPKNRGPKDVIYTVVVACLLFMVLINSGLLKYQSLVVGSNSMLPYMKRGDVIIVEKTKKSIEKRNIDVGEILVFKYDGKIVTHRVSRKIERQNAVYYKTKGDNNNEEDLGLIEEKQIIGTVKLRIKDIGLLSIWINELLKK